MKAAGLWIRRATLGKSLPYDAFDRILVQADARRAHRMENIYHVGQAKAWDGREVLAELVAKHGKPTLPAAARSALARVYSIVMWGELGAWKISAQLADQLPSHEARLAATSQAHDEARHFYVIHDYLELLGEPPPLLGYWSERVLMKTLATPDILKKVLGMQLIIEPIALSIFQRVRELEVEPVLSELMRYYERDESRHVGLGIQLVPQLMANLSYADVAGLAVFQLDLLTSTLLSLKSIETDLLVLGMDPRSLLALGFRRQKDIDAMIQSEFPQWPSDSPPTRIFGGMCEALFPSEGADVQVGVAERLAHGLEVAARKRTGVVELWAGRRDGVSTVVNA